MAKEIELKLYFPAGEQAKIEAHPLIASAKTKGEAEFLENTYFDTPELTLHARKIAVRTRRTRAGMLQTIKCAAASVGGLSARPEWEKSYSGEFDFSLIDHPDVRDLLENEKSRLIPVFTTNFQRQTWQYAPAPGIRILVMLDSGSVTSPQGEAPISELELELAEGSALDLRNFAIELAATLPLIPFDPSKAERGYQLFLNENPRPTKAGKTPVHAAMPSGAAFRALAHQGLVCWQANLLGALTHADPEYVHQFRVALRRLNTLLKLFKPVLPGDFCGRWATALKDLSTLTGEVRDLDVMRESILLPMLKTTNRKDKILVKQAIAACASARAAADSALEQLQSGQPLLMFARDLSLLPLADLSKKIERYAEKRLGKLQRNAALRLREAVKSPSPENAHRFRISLKHLRYGCEFFAPLFDEEAMLQYAKEIAGLQDELGFLNDLHVALCRIDDWAKNDEKLKKSRAHVARWHAKRADEKLTKALTMAESLLGECLPWCGECERRGLGGLRRRLRQGISIKIA